MAISYKTLWKPPIDKDMKKKDLQLAAGVSSTSITEPGKNENVNTEVLQAKVDIDWQKLYPFKDANGNIIIEENTDEEEEQQKEPSTPIEIFKAKTQFVEDCTEIYVTDYLSLYNDFTVRDGGYLIRMQAKEDVSVAAESTIGLANYCKEQGSEFVYVEYPDKICVYDDSDISGIMDFSNQNVDKFLSQLKSKGVLTYDLRLELHNEGLDHHSLFFNTDHHWKPQTGLWASQRILKFLNESLGMNFDTKILDSENYDELVYEDWFLGFAGKKVTLSVCEPDDISLIYPKYDTSIHYEVPSLAIDECGTFDIIYDMKCIEEKDYYNNNPYAAYNHGDQALVKIENKLIDDDTHVLIIHDSFSNCVIPFIAMSVKYVDAIDLRHFTGSLQSYISQKKPDIVIVAYPLVTENVYYSKHADTFDFR